MSEQARSWDRTIEAVRTRLLGRAKRAIGEADRPRYSAADVVDALYSGLLHRAPDSGGLRHNIDSLLVGMDLADVVRGVVRSPEYLTRGREFSAIRTHVWPGIRQRRNEPCIYFLHIMKTGGTALVDGLLGIAEDRFCLTDIFLDHLVLMPAVLVDGACLVSGHLGLEALDLLSPDTVTTTVIRQPVERVLSHYSHVLVDPALAGETDGLTLEEFVHAPRWRPYAENFQARSLVNRVGLTDVWRSRSPDDLIQEMAEPSRPAQVPFPLQTSFELGRMPSATDGLEAHALAQLSRIEYVGIQDQLDKLFGRLAAIWGNHQAPSLAQANVGRGRVQTPTVSPQLRRDIEEANVVDCALYEAARKRTWL